MKKVLVSDYDQTFYISDLDIENNKLAVKNFRGKGNLFIVATGRSYQDFKNKVKEYNLEYDYVIIDHGATILDKYDNILINYCIDNKIVKNIKDDLQLDKSLARFCCSVLESRVDFDYPDLTKINVRYDSKETAMEINNIINSKYSDYVNSYYVVKDSIEIISNDTTKSRAIKFLINKLNIDINNVYTIGDGYSDIDMIKDYNGYAMKDSVDELKKYALNEYESVSGLINEII